MRYLQADPDRQRAVMELFGNSFDWGSEARTGHGREDQRPRPRELGAGVAGPGESPRLERSVDRPERGYRAEKAQARTARGRP